MILVAVLAGCAGPNASDEQVRADHLRERTARDRYPLKVRRLEFEEGLAFARAGNDERAVNSLIHVQRLLWAGGVGSVKMPLVHEVYLALQSLVRKGLEIGSELIELVPSAHIDSPRAERELLELRCAAAAPRSPPASSKE